MRLARPLKKRLKNRKAGQSTLELVVFIPVFMIVFVVFFWFNWAINGSIVHQMHSRGQLFALLRNSRILEFRHRQNVPTQESIQNNNFIIGYSYEDPTSGVVAPEYATFFDGSWSTWGKQKIRTIFGICTQSFWLGSGTARAPYIPNEAAFRGGGGPFQDPYELCR